MVRLPDTRKRNPSSDFVFDLQVSSRDSARWVSSSTDSRTLAPTRRVRKAPMHNVLRKEKKKEDNDRKEEISASGQSVAYLARSNLRLSFVVVSLCFVISLIYTCSLSRWDFQLNAGKSIFLDIRFGLSILAEISLTAPFH